MADDERQNPPRKRARLNSDSPPRRRRREDDTNDTDANEPRGDAAVNVEPAFAAPGAALPFPLSDRDRASLFFRTFLVRMASPILQYTTGPPPQAPLLPTAIPNTEGRNMRDIARAVSAVVGGNLPSTVPHQQEHQGEGQELPHRHGGELMDVENEPTARHHDELVADAAVGVAMMAEEAGGHHENDQENDHDHDGETVATEESNTDDEDLQQLSMVMCDGLLQQQNDALLAAQCYLPSEVSYEDVQHLIFHSAKEQKQVLIEKLFKLIKKTPNGGDTIARLVKAEDETGLTLLMISVRQELVALCQLLIEEGADVNQCNEKRPFALLLAAQKGHEGATRFLLEHGANDESKNMALIPAAHFGHLGVVGLLLEFGADQNYSNKKGTTPLMRAAQEGRDAVVQFLIDKGAVAYAANNEGMTALMLAAQRGHANIATILIRAGSDVDTQTRQGSTALLLAAKRGHTEAVEALLTAGADIFLKDDRHKTAADTAHRRGHIDLFLKITVSNQLRLMREALRRERYAELMRLSYLYVLSRATLVPAFKSPERHRLNVLLDRTMRLPRPLLQNIALFLPMCNVWERQLKYLAYEAPFHPSKVVQHGIRMLDDILVSVALDVRTSLQRFRQADTQYGGRHLALLRDNAEFFGVFTSECNVGICPDVLARLRRMADIQGALASYAAGTGIQFGVEVAQDVVALVADLLAWEDARKRLVFRTAATTYEEEDGMGSVRIKEEEPYRI